MEKEEVGVTCSGLGARNLMTMRAGSTSLMRGDQEAKIGHAKRRMKHASKPSFSAYVGVHNKGVYRMAYTKFGSLVCVRTAVFPSLVHGSQ